MDAPCCRTLTIDDQVNRRLAALRQAGRQAAAVARRAERIIARLGGQSGGYTASAGLTTRYGEKRLAGCTKYDLGAGYRLITLRGQDSVCIRFLGTHDECQKWLQTHSRRSLAWQRRRSVLMAATPACDEDFTQGSETDLQDRDEDHFPEVDQRLLRVVFPAFCRT